MKRLLVLIAAALVLGLVGGSIAFGQEDEEVSADDVVAEFASITVAEAEALGYAEETPCVDASELVQLSQAKIVLRVGSVLTLSDRLITTNPRSP